MALKNIHRTSQTFKYVKRTLIDAFQPLNTSGVHLFLHLTLEKHQRYSLSSFVKTRSLTWGVILKSLKDRYNFVVRERHCYISLSFFTSKNVSGILFDVHLLLNTLFGMFSGILICKYLSRMYVAAV